MFQMDAMEQIQTLRPSSTQKGIFDFPRTIKRRRIIYTDITTNLFARWLDFTCCSMHRVCHKLANDTHISWFNCPTNHGMFWPRLASHPCCKHHMVRNLPHPTDTGTPSVPKNIATPAPPVCFFLWHTMRHTANTTNDNNRKNTSHRQEHLTIMQQTNQEPPTNNIEPPILRNERKWTLSRN